ncbi:DNA cytosine methyltransferase [Comamonadaceae bacterium PP-2]
MKRDDFTLGLDLGHELIIDNFAGGGGTSTGLERAFGRPVDIAINHDPEALAMHAINHPLTRHLCESVWDVDPIAVTGNQPVALVWLSPDCKHFSKAKGGTPVAKHIRGLAWVGMRWAALTKPRVIMLENVEEFTTWGPLLVGADGMARPDPARRGRTFESFVRQLRTHGYDVEWRERRACDDGAPTIRKRLFLIARRDGLPIVWPSATHGNPASIAVMSGKLLPWRSAAECIDFSLPSQSIFGRKKALADNTLRRVVKGLWRHVLTSPKPFIVGMGDDLSAIAPTLQPLRGTSESHLQGDDVAAPLSTISAGGTHHALAAAALVPVAHGERRPGETRTADLNEPIGTVHAGGGSFALAAVCLEQANGGFYEGDGRPADAPMSTITSAGSNQRLITAYCVKYYSNGGQWQGLAEPMHTLPTKGRMGLVQCVKVAADCPAPELRERARQCAALLHQYLPEHFPEPADLILVGDWMLVDIMLRMLKAPELFLAQSFPPSYVIHEIPNPALLFKGGVQAADPLSVPRIPLSATAQVRMCGNSVAPIQAEALARANFSHEHLIYGRAAA